MTALGLVGNREDALELSQEAFFRAYQHYDQFNAKGKFFPWFYQILRNLCFSHLRKRRVRRAHESRMDDCAWMTGDPDGNPQSPIPNPQSGEGGDRFDPEMIAERNESKDRIWRAIGQLDEKHREVIVLRHFRNLSYDEMAKLLFCNRGTVTSRLFYARQRLKEILEGSPKPDVSGLGTQQERGASDAKFDAGEPRKGGQTL
ncbi:MAG: RNA polymerase sigma factor [Phycisphaerae bacterium]|nr:RNA polymerase sigma factor [Phycisphaerae bacterium]